MKVKYFAALAAASVFGMTALTSCGGDTTEVETPDAAETEVAPDAAAEPCAADPCAAAEEEEDPCAGS